MASLIPGYEYDIFISYRQKDNKGDKWVSRLVDALKTELEATFKEDISIYFDENPHDRLQETHNVNKSLEGKLKCLIFIPILSQTYCDPDSYAWQYEFMAFLRMTEKDRFGKDVRLRSGNVAGRILPIRIHDLESEDIKLFEKETGSVLRALDFIFKTSTGVSRPLKANEDHPNDNLSKTFYDDQINKVAHAIKEIISGLKTELIEPGKEKIEHIGPLEGVRKVERMNTLENPAKLSRLKMRSGFVFIAILVIMAALAFPKVFHLGKNKVAKDPDGRISLAITNFDNNTNDTTLNWLNIGIPELLRNNLAISRALLVQNTQTMNELYESIAQTKNASVIPSISREAAIKLRAGNYITGSFQRYEKKILILVKLIDTKSDELLWTGQTKGNPERITEQVDSLSKELINFLEIKLLKQKATPDFGEINTNCPEALKKYIEGMQLLSNGNPTEAVNLFKESYYLDTAFTFAAFYTAYSYSYSYNQRSSAEWTRIACKGEDRLPYCYKLWVEMWRMSTINNNKDSTLYYLYNLLGQSDIKSRLFWNDIGTTFAALEKNESAVQAFENVEKIDSDWGNDFKLKDYYYNFGWTYHKLGLHDKEAKIFEKALKIWPGDGYYTYSQARCALSQGDTARGRELINDCLQFCRKYGTPESYIEANVLGDLYSESKLYEKAEEHYRKAVQLKDKYYPVRLFQLGNFLIITDRNVPEGMGIMDSLLIIEPEMILSLKFKGIGYYKVGKYNEALALLQEFSEKKPGWDPESENYTKKVKEALAHQK